MSSDILVVLESCNAREIVKYAGKLLTRGMYEPLKRWGGCIANTHKDPALHLMETLIMEDKTNILMNLHHYFVEYETHPAFMDCSVYFEEGDDRDRMSSYEMGRFLDEVNETYDDEGIPMGPSSSGIALWARWLRNDHSVCESLMYAIAKRYWRMMNSSVQGDIIRGISLYAHAHLFYNMGWDPDTRVCDVSGANSDSHAYLCGKDIVLTSHEEFVSGEHVQQKGSLVFNCIPRVHHSVWEKEGFEVEDDRVLSFDKGKVLPVMSFGNDGIAVRGCYNSEKTGYFLEYPEEYECGAGMIWDNVFE
jgi:hypothetical protein